MPEPVYWQTKEWWEQGDPPHYKWGTSELADFHGGAHGTWQHRRRRARGLFPGLDWIVTSQGMTAKRLRDATPEPGVLPPNTVRLSCSECMSTEEKVERDAVVSGLRSQLSKLTTRYDVALRDKTVAEYLSRQAERIMPRLSPVTAPAVISKRSGKSKETAVLFWADWHADEIVSPEVMDGLNSYDPGIMARRVECMTDKALEMLLDHHAGTTFDELVIADLGDSIGGPLHQETAMTNALPPFRACVMVSDIKAQAVAKMAAHFKRVRRVSVPGNHWRYTKQPPWKMPTETSDWLVYNYEALRLADLGNVEVSIPHAWTETVEIGGVLFSLNHGYSDAKGGFGGLSAYALFRADAKRTGIDARRGRFVPYRVYGHMHTPNELAKLGGKGRIIVCPSLKGGDEYALEQLGAYSDPEQRLVGVHGEHGIVWTRDLNVALYDTKPVCCFDDTLARHLEMRETARY